MGTFSATLNKRSVFGDMKFFIYDLTNVQTSGTSLVIDGLDVINGCWATNHTDKDEQMSAIKNSTTLNQVDLVAGSNDDDGQLFVLGH